MSRRGWVAVAIAVSWLLGPAALAQHESPPSGREPSSLVADFNFLLGQKYLDHDEWGSLDEQLLTGVETTWRLPSWRVGIAVDGLFSNAEKRRGVPPEQTVTRGSSLELGLGLRAIVPFGRIRPHLGAGPALVQGDVQVIRPHERDDVAGAGGLGWFVSGGVYGRIGQTANLGVAVRWSQARVKSGTFDADAGGMVYAVSLGFGIPPYEDP